MAAPDLAESRLRLWPECCDRVTKLGPVRGQSAASPACGFRCRRQAPVSLVA